jgi:hypothetical protein
MSKTKEKIDKGLTLNEKARTVFAKMGYKDKVFETNRIIQRDYPEVEEDLEPIACYAEIKITIGNGKEEEVLRFVFDEEDLPGVSHLTGVGEMWDEVNLRARDLIDSESNRFIQDYKATGMETTRKLVTGWIHRGGLGAYDCWKRNFDAVGLGRDSSYTKEHYPTRFKWSKELLREIQLLCLEESRFNYLLKSSGGSND